MTFANLGAGMANRSNISWELVWTIPTPGVHLAEERAVARGNQMHRVVQSRQFAIVRNAYDSNGYYSGNGFVVCRDSFDDLRQFDTIEEAKLYVESIYALERR